MSVLSVSEVSSRLDVTPGRVRQLIESGALRAQKVGSQWVVDDSELATLHLRTNGRPWSASSTWGLLWRAIGRPAPWLTEREGYRVDERLTKGLDPFVERLSLRAARTEFRAHPSALDRLQNDPRWVASGVSAAKFLGADLIVGDQVIEGYLRATDLTAAISDFGLVTPGSAAGNVVVHAYSGVEPFEPFERSAPMLLVALDLLEHSDQRTIRAGRALLDTFKADHA
jgi:excisionase family DNA binding protein